MANVLLPLGLAFIMFVVGIGLHMQDFWKVAHYPKAFFIGILNQCILLPLVGFGLAMLYDGPIEFALGIVILTACPGGVTSNLLSILARGNAALSISLTAFSSLLSLFSMPVTLWITFAVLTGQGTHVELPFQRIIMSIFLITGAPVMLGMYLNHRYPHLCTNIRPFIRTIATVIFAFIVMGAFISNQNNITRYFLDLGPYMIALNIITLTIGYVSARKLTSNKADSITISMESGLQNVAQAIFVAVSVLHNAELMIPAIIYAVIMNISVAAIIYWARRSQPDELSPAIE